MTTAEITQKYRYEYRLTLQAFADALSANGEHVTKMAVSYWQDDKFNPNRNFLIRTVANFPVGDWRHDWAQEVLQAIQ